MAKKRKKLSQEEINRRRKKRRAEFRAQKEKRSRAAKKGWKTRKARQKEQNELVKLRKKNKELLEKLKLYENAEKAIEQAQAEITQMVLEGVLEDYTDEQRVKVMQARWREVETLMPKRNQTRRDMLVEWVERNNFNNLEFWEEYRRRRDGKIQAQIKT